MSVLPPTDDPFRPDRPSEIEPSSRALVSALAHAAAGYPVVATRPGTKRPALGQQRMRWGTTDPETIRRWWKDPSRGVGIVLDFTGVVILDVDSAAGEESLARLAGPGGLGALPPTYEVRTSRGRHLYYRLPEGEAGRHSTQQGGQHARPGLDIKLRWLMVVPGAISASGHLYRASWDHIPVLAELPYLPAHAWSKVVASARARTTRSVGRDGPQSAAGRRVPEEWLGRRRVFLDGVAGERLERRLHDISHGKDVRVFKVVLDLLRRGAEVADIWATLMDCPLRERVWRESNPVGYFLHKVEDAEAYLGIEAREWDRVDWFRRMLRAGLKDAEVRVLACLFGESNRAGIVSIGSAKIGRGSALSPSQAAKAVEGLVDQGWLAVLREYDAKEMLPRVMALDLPAGQIADTVSSDELAPTTLHLSTRIRNLSELAGHDAFRTASDSLGTHFRLLCLIEEGFASGQELIKILACDARTLRRHMERLSRYQLVEGDSEGYRVTGEPLRPLLDAVATTAGTKGRGAAQWAAYMERCARNAEYRRRMGVMGTDEWRAAQIKDTIEGLADESMRPLLDLWRERAVEVEQVAEMMVAGREATYAATDWAFADFDWSQQNV